LRFEWSERKNRENQRKHRVSFEEAQRLFESGEDYLEIYDADHSTVEERFIAIGPIARGVVLVIWTEREEDVIRIISARFATQRESALYRAHKDSNR
jgi:uncharacterized DUF497 family protein